MKIDKSVLTISGIGAVLASLCCLSPLILVMVGLASVGFAASLSDVFYGTYRWLFRLGGFLFLLVALFFYFRKQGICTLDQYKRKRNKVINTVLIALVSFVIGYVIFLYVIVEWIGKLYGIW
ncbi:hypothetical protein HN419_02405 [Candidatus Woesearchaeota archaeon]|jgi:hypothetical protein|nr:hypothetical protein [Candidatus Woesearchaeota archaeon]MBT3537151.1 hypothetical protein [Candidatus Woesearchaeota archaeon]MBT4697722.1 hypothetical protein [Candidatus Woesearchaeota archaeon]MBT7106539.1 hypothetical protein [Candidatus Woesearchaeota archaeon]MBT7931086.1 hypothetical protein [Candidatus Woesearchaeota archaeon]